MLDTYQDAPQDAGVGPIGIADEGQRGLYLHRRRQETGNSVELARHAFKEAFALIPEAAAAPRAAIMRHVLELEVLPLQALAQYVWVPGVHTGTTPSPH